MTNEETYGNRDIADLLPWYETGRLSPEDCARVEAALAQDPALRMELDLVREELAETIAYNESLGTPSRQAADTFFAALEASPRGRAPFHLVRFVSERLEMMKPRTLALSGFAALALVVIQAGVITHLVSQGASRPDSVVSQLASVEPAGKVDGPVLIVEFAAGAKLGDVARLLTANGLTLVDGPNAGFYDVRLNGEAGDRRIDATIAALNARKDLVRSVMRKSSPE